MRTTNNSKLHLYVKYDATLCIFIIQVSLSLFCDSMSSGYIYQNFTVWHFIMFLIFYQGTCAIRVLILSLFMFSVWYSYFTFLSHLLSGFLCCQSVDSIIDYVLCLVFLLHVPLSSSIRVPFLSKCWFYHWLCSLFGILTLRSSLIFYQGSSVVRVLILSLIMFSVWYSYFTFLSHLLSGFLCCQSVDSIIDYVFCLVFLLHVPLSSSIRVPLLSECSFYHWLCFLFGILTSRSSLIFYQGSSAVRVLILSLIMFSVCFSYFTFLSHLLSGFLCCQSVDSIIDYVLCLVFLLHVPLSSSIRVPLLSECWFYHWLCSLFGILTLRSSLIFYQGSSAVRVLILSLIMFSVWYSYFTFLSSFIRVPLLSECWFYHWLYSLFGILTSRSSLIFYQSSSVVRVLILSLIMFSVWYSYFMFLSIFYQGSSAVRVLILSLIMFSVWYSYFTFLSHLLSGFLCCQSVDSIIDYVLCLVFLLHVPLSSSIRVPLLSECWFYHWLCSLFGILTSRSSLIFYQGSSVVRVLILSLIMFSVWYSYFTFLSHLLSGFLCCQSVDSIIDYVLCLVFLLHVPLSSSIRVPLLSECWFYHWLCSLFGILTLRSSLIFYQGSSAVRVLILSLIMFSVWYSYFTFLSSFIRVPLLSECWFYHWLYSLFGILTSRSSLIFYQSSSVVRVLILSLIMFSVWYSYFMFLSIFYQGSSAVRVLILSLIMFSVWYSYFTFLSHLLSGFLCCQSVDSIIDYVLCLVFLLHVPLSSSIRVPLLSECWFYHWLCSLFGILTSRSSLIFYQGSSVVRVLILSLIMFSVWYSYFTFLSHLLSGFLCCQSVDSIIDYVLCLVFLLHVPLSSSIRVPLLSECWFYHWLCSLFGILTLRSSLIFYQGSSAVRVLILSLIMFSVWYSYSTFLSHLLSGFLCCQGVDSIIDYVLCLVFLLHVPLSSSIRVPVLSECWFYHWLCSLFGILTSRSSLIFYQSSSVVRVLILSLIMFSVWYSYFTFLSHLLSGFLCCQSVDSIIDYVFCLVFLLHVPLSSSIKVPLLSECWFYHWLCSLFDILTSHFSLLCGVYHSYLYRWLCVYSPLF